MGVSDSKPQTTTTSGTSAPWGPAQGALGTALGEAQGLYQQQKYDGGPYSGPTQADLSGQSQAALGRTQQIATSYGGLLGDNAFNYANQVINSGGIAPGQSSAISQLGQTLSGAYMDPNSNPYLQNVLDAANRRTADAANAQFSAAGRYGSGAHTDVLSRNIGEQNQNAYMQNYNQERANQLAAASSLNNIYQQGQNTALNTAMNGGQITSQLYDPAQRLAGVGQAYDDRAQNQLNSNIDLYNAQRQNPWEQIAKLNAIGTGAGQLGSSSTGVQVKPGQTGLQQLLGYGTAGLGLLGKL